MKLNAAIVWITAILLAGCGLRSPHTIVYECDGTAASVDIEYRDAGGAQVQVSGAALPWSVTFSQPLELFALSLGVKNTSGVGEVACTVRIDRQTTSAGSTNDELLIALDYDRGRINSSITGSSVSP